MPSQDIIMQLERAIKALTNGKLKEVPKWILDNWDTFSYKGEEYKDTILRPYGIKYALHTALDKGERIFGICKYSRKYKRYEPIFQIFPYSNVFKKLLHMIGMNETNDYCNEHAYHNENKNLVIMFMKALNNYFEIPSQDFEYGDLFLHTKIIYED